jgi:YebC/PmpR family DNA-binding regulatory protein
MSGHSHWSTIKRKKGAIDKKRGQIFSKLSRAIIIAARERGGDPESNPKLRLAIDQAKSFNMPKEKIEGAIKSGIGELKGEKLEEVMFEAYGPGGIAIIIEGITDNKNRTLNKIKQILNQNKAKLATEGSVKWQFKKGGVITLNLNSQIEDLKDKEVLGLKSIEAGAEDLYWHNGFLDIYVRFTELEKIKENLKKEGIKVESATLDWVAKKMIETDKGAREAAERLFEALDENDAVQEIYSNLKF